MNTNRRDFLQQNLTYTAGTLTAVASLAADELFGAQPVRKFFTHQDAVNPKPPEEDLNKDGKIEAFETKHADRVELHRALNVQKDIRGAGARAMVAGASAAAATILTSTKMFHEGRKDKASELV